LKPANFFNPLKNRGWTPLFYAAHEDYVAIARELIDAGANIEAKNDVRCIHPLIHQFGFSLMQTRVVIPLRQ
jgi:ankyrin repeat protein